MGGLCQFYGHASGTWRKYSLRMSMFLVYADASMGTGTELLKGKNKDIKLPEKLCRSPKID